MRGVLSRTLSTTKFLMAFKGWSVTQRVIFNTRARGSNELLLVFTQSDDGAQWHSSKSSLISTVQLLE
jgi:hypothetical protein